MSVCATGQAAHHDVYEAQCPCRALLDLLANKWSALAIGALEDADLVTRTVYPAVPLHVEYALTDLGRGAAVPLGALRTWVEDNIDSSTSSRPA